jgi:hypothetical protein
MAQTYAHAKLGVPSWHLMVPIILSMQCPIVHSLPYARARLGVPGRQTLYRHFILSLHLPLAQTYAHAKLGVPSWHLMVPIILSMQCPMVHSLSNAHARLGLPSWQSLYRHFILSIYSPMAQTYAHAKLWVSSWQSLHGSYYTFNTLAYIGQSFSHHWLKNFFSNFFVKIGYVTHIWP